MDFTEARAYHVDPGIAEMSFSDSDVIAIGTVICAAFGTVFISLINFSARFAKLELKIDTLWDFQLRRGRVEAVRQGLATKNSPVTVTEEAKSRIKDLVEPLRAIFINLGDDPKDRDLAIAIEKYFGDELVDKICIPLKVSQGACLIIAMAVAKGE